MDEAAAVLKASDDEARRICQEIRRIGGADRGAALGMEWKRGKDMAEKGGNIPIGSMYGIYANIGGILMGSMLPYIAYMDPMGMETYNM